MEFGLYFCKLLSCSTFTCLCDNLEGILEKEIIAVITIFIGRRPQLIFDLTTWSCQNTYL